MALVRYYKFNGNLFDSVGGFDLTDRHGIPSYVTGKLNYGVTAYSVLWGAGASGAAPNAVICADATEATNGVSTWSLCFWLKITDGNYSQPIVRLLSGSGTGPVTVGYEQKFGALQFNGYGVSISTNTWYFICLRKSGSTIYYSLNAGSESTIAGTAGANYFNELTIGSTLYYHINTCVLDDLRIFNTAITTMDRDAIYNSGSPSEASTTTPTAWQSPTHQHKLNGNLTDSIGSVTATGTNVGYLGSGLFSASSNAVRLNSSGASLSASDTNFAGAAKSSGSFSFFNWHLVGNAYLNYPPASWTVGPLTHVSDPKGFRTTFNSINVGDESGFSSSCCLYVYNDIFQRLAIYGFDAYYNPTGTNLVVLAEIAASRPAQDITGWTFDNGTSGGASTISDIDEVRFYPVALTGGDYVQLYNGGAGTESASGGAVNGNASGGLGNITMSSASGSASGSASQSAGLATITMSGPSGSGAGGAIMSASLATMTMSAPSGSSVGGANGSPGLATVSVQTLSGGASGNGGSSANANGSLGEIAISALSGSASGTITGSATGALITITMSGLSGSVYAWVTPTYGWKFQSAIPVGAPNAGDFLDSIYGERLDNTSANVGTLSYPIGQGLSLVSNPWSAAYLGNALALQGTNSEQKLSWPGGGQISNSSDPISFCFWVRDTSNITNTSTTKTFRLIAYNFQLNVTRSGFSNTFNSALYFFYNQSGYDNAYADIGGGSANTPSNVDFLAISFTPSPDAGQAVFKIWKGSGGTLSLITPTFGGVASGWFVRSGMGAVEISNIQAGTISQTTSTVIDDLRLFNRAITASEVYAIYNSGAGSEYTENASAAGNFSTVLLTGLSGSAFGSVSATATGGLVTITISGLTGQAAQGASGLLGTIAANAPTGVAFGTVNATATGGLSTINIIALAGTAAATAGGTLPTITMTAPNAVAAFGPSGALPFVLMTAASGSAAGGATKSGALGTIALTTPTGTSLGGGTGTGSLPTITLSSLSGSATASTGGIGALGTITVSAITGSGTGSVITAGALATVTLTSQAGAATGSALPSSDLATVALSGSGGLATGSAPASGALATIPVSTPAGTAAGNAPNSGILGTITMSGPAGSATGMAPASGAFTPVVITAPAGSVTGNATPSGAMASVSLTPSGGSASGSSPAAGILGTVTLSAPSTSATGSAGASGAAPIIVVAAFSGSASVSVSPSGNMPVVSVSEPSGSATGQLVGQVFSPVLIITPSGSALAISTATGTMPGITLTTPAGNATGTATGRPVGPIVSMIPPDARAYPVFGGTPASVHIVDLPVLGG